jgi:hypothetical protein
LPKESPSPNFPSENNSNIGNNTNKTPSASQPIVYPTCPNAMTPCDSAGTICSNGGVCKRLPASQGGGLCCEATPSPNKPSSESSSSNAVTSPKKITRLDSSSANNQNTQFQTTITQKTKIKFFAKLKSLFLGKSTGKAISSTTSTGNCENPCNGMNVGDCCTGTNCAQRCERLPASQGGGLCCVPTPSPSQFSSSSSTFSFSNNFLTKLKTVFGINKKIQFYSCYDSEGSPQNLPNPTIRGYINVTYSENNGPLQTQTVYDTCEPAASFKNVSKVDEYFCKTSTQPAKSVIPCEVGKYCENGACVGGLVCNDTDNGKDYILYGETSGYDPFEHEYLTYDDSCLSEDELIEGYCVYTGEVDREYKICDITCSNTGVCVDPSATGNAFNCLDSDGGINAVVKGNAIGPSAQTGQQSRTITDTCNMVNSGNGLTPVLTEAYCQSNGQVSTISIVCPNGCGDGICNPVTGGATGCTDSDNGITPQSLGTVAGNYYGINGWTFTDSCAQSYSNSEYYLKEGYCENNHVHVKNILCDGICIGGVCTPKNTSKSSGSGVLPSSSPTSEDENNLQISLNKIQLKEVAKNIPSIRYKTQ